MSSSLRLRKKRVRKVKYYPLLPKRPKRPKGARRAELASSVSLPILYRQVQYSRRYQAVPNLYDVLYNVNRDRTCGAVAFRTFQRNVNWKEQVAKGQNANYPYQRTGGTVVPLTYNGTTKSATIVSTSWGSEVGSTMIEHVLDQNLKDLAMIRLKRRLNGYVGQASLMAPLAESREIHRLVRDINGYAMTALKDLLLIKRTKGKSIIKHAGQVWLTLGFGVNPLLSDIAKAVQSIEDYKTRQDRSVRIHGTASKEWQSQLVLSNRDIGYATTYDIVAAAKHQLSYRYSGGVDLQIGTSSSYNWSDHLGLTLGDLPATLWELTPYSWALDYFTTVGPWLEDVFYTLPGVLKYLSLNDRYQNSVTWTPMVKTASGNTWSGTTKVGEFKYFEFSRTPLTSLPTRQLRIKSVDEVAKYGLTKVLNLASVLAGRLKTPRH